MRSEAENELQHMLIKCITACEVCATECLKEPNAGEMEKCIRTDRDCADICALLSRYIARQSRFTGAIMEECIRICGECEAECRKHDTWHCQKCAEICNECQQHCKSYLQEHFQDVRVN